MKKICKLLVLLISLTLILCGCTKKTEQSAAKYDLGGKTYYNHDDRYELSDASSVWFGKDGSFVLRDNYFDGWYQITGTWAVSENVVTLDVTETGVGEFTKIRFEIKDDSELILKTSIAGSQSDDHFRTDKPEITDTVELIYTTYYDADSPFTNKSYLELNEDGSFLLADMDDFGIFEYTGTYVLIGENLILNIDHDIDGLSQIFMTRTDADTFVLNQNLGVARTGDRFCIPGTDPAIPGPEGAPTLENSEWRHEKIQ
ncbi:MAG: hypothetical protein J5365_04150, partial [Erysipelotrichaceae bacterium]|nr:hypothetical protein [Erysipelotrichaceae bacterium]